MSKFVKRHSAVIRVSPFDAVSSTPAPSQPCRADTRPSRSRKPTGMRGATPERVHTPVPTCFGQRCSRSARGGTALGWYSWRWCSCCRQKQLSGSVDMSTNIASGAPPQAAFLARSPRETRPFFSFAHAGKRLNGASLCAQESVGDDAKLSAGVATTCEARAPTTWPSNCVFIRPRRPPGR